jgi:hypothetical protein
MMRKSKQKNLEFEVIVELLSNINNLLYFIADDIQKKNEKEAKVIVKQNKGELHRG